MIWAQRRLQLAYLCWRARNVNDERFKEMQNQLCRETWLSQYIFGFFFSLPVVIKETWRSQYIFVFIFFLPVVI